LVLWLNFRSAARRAVPEMAGIDWVRVIGIASLAVTVCTIWILAFAI